MLFLSNISKKDYQQLTENSHVIEKDYYGPKVISLKNGQLLKLFRVRRRLSFSAIYSRALTFCENAKRLQGLSIETLTTQKKFYIPHLKRSAVVYDPLPGISIREYAEKNSVSKDVIIRLADFIAHLHAKGIYFRSLHPGNIIITPDNTMGLIDIYDMHFEKGPLSKDKRLRNFRHITRYLDESPFLQGDNADVFLNAYLSLAPQSQQSYLKRTITPLFKTDNTKKKILQLCYKANETVAQFDLFEEVIRAFDPNEYDITYAIMLGEPNKEMQQRLPCHVHYFEFSKEEVRGFGLQAIIQIKRFIQQEGFDTVITHRYKPSYFMSIVSLFYQPRRVIAAFHGLDQIKRLPRRLLAQITFKKNWRIVGVSEAVAKNIESCGINKNQIKVIRNAINVDAMIEQQLSKNEARTVLDIAPEKIVIGNIGITREVKAQNMLIDGFAPLAKENPNLHLLIVGGGPLEDDLRQQAEKLGIAQQVTITGLLPNAYRYVRAMDIFIMSSRYEGFSITLLEAMSAKLPIVATAVGGMPEVLGERGILIPALDPVPITQALDKILSMSPEEKNDYSEHLHARLRENFSIERYHQEYRKLLDD